MIFFIRQRLFDCLARNIKFQARNERYVDWLACEFLDTPVEVLREDGDYTGWGKVEIDLRRGE